MGKLDRSWGYLSGPMEFVSDHGVMWRRKMIRLINETELDIDLIDPTDKPEDTPIGEDQQYQQNLQRSGKFRELQEFVSDYRRKDLRYVDLCDFIVAVIDPRVPQWGTSDEVYFAESEHKPIFFICDGGLEKLPRWLFDVIDPIDNFGKTNVYQSVEEVISELILLDSGQKPLSKEWVLIRKIMEERRVKSRNLTA